LPSPNFSLRHTGDRPRKACHPGCIYRRTSWLPGHPWIPRAV